MNQIRDISALFLELLLSSKHFGVIEKSQNGFRYFNEALLSSRVPCLMSVVKESLDVLISRVASHVRKMINLY